MLGDAKSFDCGRTVAGFTPSPSLATQQGLMQHTEHRADSNSPTATERPRLNSITVKPSARHLLGDSVPVQVMQRNPTKREVVTMPLVML
jgi:hypothetical protein